jgi:hypothetical protein
MIKKRLKEPEYEYVTSDGAVFDTLDGARKRELATTIYSVFRARDPNIAYEQISTLVRAIADKLTLEFDKFQVEK